MPVPPGPQLALCERGGGLPQNAAGAQASQAAPPNGRVPAPLPPGWRCREALSALPPERQQGEGGCPQSHRDAHPLSKPEEATEAHLGHGPSGFTSVTAQRESTFQTTVLPAQGALLRGPPSSRPPSRQPRSGAPSSWEPTASPERGPRAESSLFKSKRTALETQPPGPRPRGNRRDCPTRSRWGRGVRSSCVDQGMSSVCPLPEFPL